MARTRHDETIDQVTLTIPQTAARLGWSERATWQALYRGRIPYRRLGKKVFVLQDELDKFLRSLPGVSAEEATLKTTELGAGR